MVMHTEWNRRYMEGNKRKSKGCYYKAQKKNNLVEVRKKRLIQQKWKGKKRELRKILRYEKKKK